MPGVVKFLAVSEPLFLHLQSEDRTLVLRVHAVGKLNLLMRRASKVFFVSCLI